VKQEPAEATMRNCHGNAVGILVIHGEEDVNRGRKSKDACAQGTQSTQRLFAGWTLLALIAGQSNRSTTRPNLYFFRHYQDWPALCQSTARP